MPAAIYISISLTCSRQLGSSLLQTRRARALFLLGWKHWPILVSKQALDSCWSLLTVSHTFPKQAFFDLATLSVEAIVKILQSSLLTKSISFDTAGPMFPTLPSFSTDKGYHHIKDKNHTAYHDAWRTSVDAFTWLSQHSESFSDFNQCMMTQRRTAPTWLSEYPFEAQSQGWDPKKPLFVDVGGGIGHQCMELIDRYPNLPGRLVLQDLAYCIGEPLQSSWLEVMVHEIYDRQPIRGR